MVECEARGERGRVCRPSPAQLWDALDALCTMKCEEAYMLAAEDSAFEFWSERANEAYCWTMCLMSEDEDLLDGT